MLLSATTSYHLRQLVHKNRGRLKFIVAPNAGLEAHVLADLDMVLTSLYLDDEAIQETASQLERLVFMYQALKEQGDIYAQQRSDIEKKILWLLGFLLVEEKQTI
jgi:hypothetical protein